jgi:hypothetical protein
MLDLHCDVVRAINKIGMDGGWDSVGDKKAGNVWEAKGPWSRPATRIRAGRLTSPCLVRGFKPWRGFASEATQAAENTK